MKDQRKRKGRAAARPLPEGGAERATSAAAPSDVERDETRETAAERGADESVNQIGDAEPTRGEPGRGVDDAVNQRTPGGFEAPANGDDLGATERPGGEA